MKIPIRFQTALVLAALLNGCAPADPAAVPLGAPLAELTADELNRFRAGEVLFNRVFSAAEGIGPLFNENQCSACHTFPASGGTGEQRVVKATRFSPPERCDLLSGQGGENVRSRSTPALQRHGMARQPVPNGATEQGRFSSPFLFGLGLVENIPAAAILKRADPGDEDGDGISGRVGYDRRGQHARLGRKAEFATVRDFIDSALRLEMGLTTPLHPQEPWPSTQPMPANVDPAPDPEINATSLERLTDFVRFLAPPARHRQTSGPEYDRARRGEILFHQIRCSACHVPFMTTGKSTVRALDRRRVYLYSDLLLHDLGPALGSVCGITATPTETRTEPLMGLGQRRLFLHDGRTNDLSEAILLHGGEGLPARERFRALKELDQHDLIAFLRTL